MSESSTPLPAVDAGPGSSGEASARDLHRSFPIEISAGRGPVLLVGTRKGAFFLSGGRRRKKWTLSGPAFLGHIVHHVMADPRDGQTILAALRTGHLGPTVFRSTDLGRTWREAARPPAFTKATDGRKSNTVEQVFWLTPGHASEPGVWYAGTSPEGLFRSEDGGNSWQPVSGWNDHPNWIRWTGDMTLANPGGSPVHSILIDPRDPKHMYIGTSSAGIFETLDQGATWHILNKGMLANFNPDPHPEYGYDPHCVTLHPQAPDVLYQQNHCGIYRMHRPEARWVRVGDNMPRDVGDIGFGIVLHARDPDTAWVFPMDGTDVWPRTSPDGRPAVYRTRDAGASWQRCDAGLPAANAWLTVLRQGMAADERDPVGVYFGTTSGAVWASRDEGDSWQCLAQHLPDVYSVEVAEFTDGDI